MTEATQSKNDASKEEFATELREVKKTTSDSSGNIQPASPSILTALE
jgi:hypothetical protein